PPASAASGPEFPGPASSSSSGLSSPCPLCATVSRSGTLHMGTERRSAYRAIFLWLFTTLFRQRRRNRPHARDFRLGELLEHGPDRGMLLQRLDLGRLLGALLLAKRKFAGAPAQRDRPAPR